MDVPATQVMPKLGYWWAECCVLDLYQLTTQEQVDELTADIIDRWTVDGTNFGLGVWPTLEEAFAALYEPHDDPADWANFGIVVPQSRPRNDGEYSK